MPFIRLDTPLAHGSIDVPVLPVARPAPPVALPPAGPLRLDDVQLPVGRAAPARPPFQLLAEPMTPALWLTDDVVPDAARVWRRLVDQFPLTGLWPLLLAPLYGDDRRPWDSGEFEPVDATAIDDLDVVQLLVDRWRDAVVPIGGPTVHPAIERALAPFGAPFPGLAPSLGPPAGQPEPRVPVPLAALPVARAARIGLVPCARPADAVARIGWLGSINTTGPAEVSAVLRSWEDRFGVVLAGLQFATLTLLVPHPPTDEAQALAVAAEIVAFCPDALWQGSDGAWLGSDDTIRGLARLLLHRPVWRVWFD